MRTAHATISSLLLSMEPYSGPVIFSTIVVVGLTLGCVLDATPNIPEPYGRLSSIIGWTYFASWSMSFWPQIITNFRRQSVVGVSLDYQLYNLLGFVSYMIFNCAFFYSGTVQADYMALHDGHRNAVQINDVFFAIHALSATIVQVTQCVVYHRGDQTLSLLSQVVVGAAAVSCALFYMLSLVSSTTESFFTTLNFLYLLSYVKLGATLVKYIPQVYLNYDRKSTVGYSIWGILVDFLGSILSIGQLVMDGAVTDDWSAVTGDPVKFGLGAVCIFFDLVFMVQHYILYPHATHDEPEEDPLLKKVVPSDLRHAPYSAIVLLPVDDGLKKAPIQVELARASQSGYVQV
ncbi:Aste57867_16931 [Aphanomyces stellatus]|uniref:Aste57867_16931 protein n=1 Tax=Aphanomyces stellatus TaxID=120398 RepID=A0A485L6X5_9STRA|nr:hypothetical protein As57867_016873 [Aphanomyces stellatus]VFT93693.1 Aste57867_16931 [Aphanomyces stellatus]